MKLLIITQKVDKNDPILGFFHKWIEELSKNFESVKVVCLQKGESSLHSNVEVFSLGKEGGKSKIKYVLNFYKYIWRLRKGYDAVFVHMNQEYVLLGSLFWKILNKKIFFWRNHPKGSFLTSIAVWFSKKVFCTSDSAFTAKFAKTLVVPVGIDTDLFINSKSEIKNPKSILSLGRISPIKNIDKILDALETLDKEAVDVVFDIVGQPVNKEDFGYLNSLKNKYKDLVNKGKVNFLGSVKNNETPKIYNNHKIFVNLTPSGSMDKTILEAAACGCIPIVANSFFEEIFEPEMIVEENGHDLSNKIKFWLEADQNRVDQVSQKLQKYVLENHSLNALIDKLCITIKG